MNALAAISSSEAPRPLAGAPYSPAIRAGELVFVSGQLGLAPGESELADGVEAQTERALQNVGALLQAAGTNLNRLVKTTVFLADLGDWPAMNDVYARFVGDRPPARTAIEAKLPGGALVEIEAVARL
jgi:2-iminobutanoate/2-iminopropanoate deaminase